MVVRTSYRYIYAFLHRSRYSKKNNVTTSVGNMIIDATFTVVKQFIDTVSNNNNKGILT